MKIHHFAILLIAIVQVACGQRQPSNENEPVEPEAVQQQEPCMDSLLKGVVRASELDLPMLWTDSIYDTCQTHCSTDGKYIAFIGKTEEDVIRNSQYGIYGNDKEALFNSVFLYFIEGDSTFLVSTASPTIGPLAEPQIDSKKGWLYFLQGDVYHSRGFYRYSINKGITDYLTGSHDNLTYTLKPNGNILFHNVREDVAVWDSSAFENEDSAMTGWLGYVFCDIEMTPSGICVAKSEHYTYSYDGQNAILDSDVGFMGILSNKNLRHKWNDSLRETQYFNKKGALVGYTRNNVESYDGWDGLKTIKQHCSYEKAEINKHSEISCASGFLAHPFTAPAHP